MNKTELKYDNIVEALRKTLKDYLDNGGKKYRIKKATGINIQTLTKFEEGKMIHGDTIEKLGKWIAKQ